MELVDIVDLLAVIFDVCLIQFYLAVFFDNKFRKKTIRIPLIFIGTVIYYCSSVYADSPFLRMVIYLSVCLLFSFSVQGVLLKKIFLIFLYAIIGIMVESITGSILITVENKFYIINRTDYTDLYISGVFLANVLIFLLMLTLNFLRNKYIKKTSTSLDTVRYLLFVLLITLFIGLFFNIHYLFLTSASVQSMQVFLVSLLIMVALAVLLYFTFAEMEHLQTVKWENILIKDRLKAQENFYRESIAKNQQLHTQIHDEKNLLLALKGLLENNSTAKALAIINDKLGNISVNTTAYSGDIALDTLLSIKISEAQTHGILLKPNIAIFDKIYIDSLDLVLLLGNILDNALEACQKIDSTSSKQINLSLKTKNDYLAVSIANPYFGEQIDSDLNKIISGKKDQLHHGYGLKSVNFIAQKYNGICKLKTQNNMFVLDILLLNRAK